jgi:basic membrane lipoprotein Med (substrate-binding protein (PBP1-ABC) superfamily)
VERVAYAGLQRIHRELGAQVSYAETRTPAEFDEGFRDFARRGYDLVFGHGFEFQDAANRVGAEYPGTTFITTSGSAVRANVAPMVFRLEESTYLCGILAAHLSRTKILGMIGGMELPPVRGGFLAFAAGARSVDPAIRVLTSYIGNWEDVGAAKEAALAQIGRGADILIHNADAAGLGVFQAARDSSGVLVFGTNKNQNDLAPEITVASAALDIPQAFVAAALCRKDGPSSRRDGPFQGTWVLG